jgi:hypothetical protein
VSTGWRRYSPRTRTSSEGRNVQPPTTIDSESGVACARARADVEQSASTEDADASRRSGFDRIIGLVEIAARARHGAG